MTAAERLKTLAGTSGTAAALLMMIGTGATAGEAIVNYSGLQTGTAEQHLLVDKAVTPPAPPPLIIGGGGFIVRPSAMKHKKHDEEYALMVAAGIM